MRRNNRKLFEKREQIGKKALIVGMDIGSQFHAVVFQNKQGLILKAYEKIYNNRNGFEYLVREIEKMLKRNCLREVHIGFEPTGYYWKNIIYYLDSKGYLIKFLRTTAVKSQRELDASSSTKTDISDANDIASLVREGKYIDAKLQHGVYMKLRDAGKLRANIMRKKTGQLCRLRMLMNMYFPELSDQFWATDSVGFWRVVKTAPFPEDIEELGREKLKELLSVSGVNKKRLEEQVENIYTASKKSVGIKTSEFDRYNIRACVEALEMYHRQLQEIKKAMKRLLEDTEYWELMDSIPGVGVVTAATFLGELGDPVNFKDAKSIIKFAGIDPKENSSGLYKSKAKISKKGRYLRRTMIYFICMRLIYRSEEFKGYYHYKLETKNIWGRHIEKKEAIFAVAIKFIKILFAMFRDKTEYSSLKVKYRLAA